MNYNNSLSLMNDGHQKRCEENVEQARALQFERYKEESFQLNGQMTHRAVRKFCVLSSEAEDLINTVFRQFHLSARSYDRILSGTHHC